MKKTTYFFLIFLQLLSVRLFSDSLEDLIKRDQVYFMKIGPSFKNVYKSHSFDSEVVKQIQVGDIGRVITVKKFGTEKDQKTWIKVETKKREGYIHLTDDIILTLNDLINVTELDFSPNEVINLPTSIDKSKLPKNLNLHFEFLNNQYAFSLINENPLTGNLILKNTKNELFTFPNSTFLKQNIYEKNLIFQGFPKYGESFAASGKTVLNFKNKIIELNYPSNKSDEHFDHEEGYSIPYNRTKILPGKSIFFHNIYYDFQKKETIDCEEIKAKSNDKCFKKIKSSEYFLAILNIDEEPIFDFIKNKGITKKYSNLYKIARPINK